MIVLFISRDFCFSSRSFSGGDWYLGGGFNRLFFSTNQLEMIQFDSYFPQMSGENSP